MENDKTFLQPIKINNQDQFIKTLQNNYIELLNKTSGIDKIAPEIIDLLFSQLGEYLTSLREKELIENELLTKIRKNKIIELKKRNDRLNWAIKELEVTNEILTDQITERDENGNYKYLNAVNSRINLIKTDILFNEKFLNNENEISKLELEDQYDLKYYAYSNKDNTYILNDRNKHLLFTTFNQILHNSGLTPLSLVKFNNLLLSKNQFENIDLFGNDELDDEDL